MHHNAEYDIEEAWRPWRSRRKISPPATHRIDVIEDYTGSSPALTKAAETVGGGGLRKAAKSRRLEHPHRLLPTGGVTAKQGLTKIDGTTTKVPITNEDITRPERRRHTSRCRYSTSE
ncbi:unnamed protein product [Soboliphyme baturini]|uniref:Uncharacterized protein n=1 Tax=Soboliphyme baturini TaxID=241478 RepID=A0A183IJ57_9BILA|nr:unnamed protein product [Soboliphyme baturini]